MVPISIINKMDSSAVQKNIRLRDRGRSSSGSSSSSRHTISTSLQEHSFTSFHRINQSLFLGSFGSWMRKIRGSFGAGALVRRLLKSCFSGSFVRQPRKETGECIQMTKLNKKVSQSCQHSTSCTLLLGMGAAIDFSELKFSGAS
jgi:hypothetical protein